MQISWQIISKAEQKILASTHTVVTSAQKRYQQKHRFHATTLSEPLIITCMHQCKKNSGQQAHTCSNLKILQQDEDTKTGQKEKGTHNSRQIKGETFTA